MTTPADHDEAEFVEGYTADQAIDEMGLAVILINLRTTPHGEQLRQNILQLGITSTEGFLKHLSTADTITKTNTLIDGDSSQSALSAQTPSSFLPVPGTSSSAPPAPLSCKWHPNATSHTTSQCKNPGDKSDKQAGLLKKEIANIKKEIERYKKKAGVDKMEPEED